MTIKRMILGGLFAALFAGGAQAHPHVWVTIETEIEHDGEGRIVAMRNRWTFDEMFSSYAILGLDTNKDGKYDREELAELAKVNVTSLKEFEFFTFIREGEGYAPLRDATDYWLDYVDSRLVLNFTLPLARPHDGRKAETVFAIYDPTNFVSFAYGGEGSIRLGAHAPKACKLKVPASPPQPMSMNLAAAREAQMAPENADPTASLPPADERDVVIDCKMS
ncbi:MAG: DUF1007 family protein [Hyphomicrobiales bacterium]